MTKSNIAGSSKGGEEKKKRKGRGKRRGVVSVGGRGKSTKDAETVQMVNEMLLKEDVMSLRKIAAVRGLVSDSLRRRAWPFILDVSTTSKISDSKVARSIKSKPKLSIRPSKRPCKYLTAVRIGDNLSLSQVKLVQFSLS